MCIRDSIYTYDQNETYDVVYDWRDLLDKYREEHGGDQRILMTEAYSELDLILRYYGDGERKGAQIPMNFHLLENVNKTSEASYFKKLIEEFLNGVPAGSEANWVVSNVLT